MLGGSAFATEEANMNFEDLTPEQMEKAKACKTTEELIELAGMEGVDLADEQLRAISGGSWYDFCWSDCTDCPDDDYDPNNWA